MASQRSASVGSHPLPDIPGPLHEDGVPIINIAESASHNRSLSVTPSVVDSLDTDDGILTPTATVATDDSPSEVSQQHLPAPAPAFETCYAETKPSIRRAEARKAWNAKEPDQSFESSTIPSISTFSSDLESAIASAWPTSLHARKSYKEVHVLILGSERPFPPEPDLKTTNRLIKVFSSLYRFEVEEIRIPFGSSDSTITPLIQMFMERNDGAENLLIVYFATFKHCDYAENMLVTLQDLCNDVAAAVLLIYDCPNTPSAVWKSEPSSSRPVAAGKRSIEVLATPPLTSGMSSTSFTASLIDQLEEAFVGPSFSVIELHGRLINAVRDQKREVMRDNDGNMILGEDRRPKYAAKEPKMPIHAFLGPRGPRRSIVLSPLPAPDTVGGYNHKPARKHLQRPSTPDFSTPTGGWPTPTSGPYFPRVLLSIQIDEDDFPHDECDENSVQAWSHWLQRIPGGLERVAIEAVYRSTSTLLLISMPFLVWEMLPKRAAYSFVGFVDSDNLHIIDANSQRYDLNADVEASHQVEVASDAIEIEVARRVEAKINVLELAALRKEKEEWHHRLVVEKETAVANGKTELHGTAGKSCSKETLESAKAPIRFKDAVGRKFSFPFALAATWQGVEELIKQAFLHVDILGPHVIEGHYDLMCASGPLNGDVILPQVWEMMVQPGWHVTMHMWPIPNPPKRSNAPPPPPPPPPGRLGGPSHQPAAERSRKIQVPPPCLHNGKYFHHFLQAPPPPPAGSLGNIQPPPPCLHGGTYFHHRIQTPRVGPVPGPPPSLRTSKPYHAQPPSASSLEQPLEPRMRHGPPPPPSMTKSAQTPEPEHLSSDFVRGRQIKNLRAHNQHLKSRSRSSSCSASSIASDDTAKDQEEAISLLEKLINAKRVYTVRKSGSMGRNLYDIRVQPRRDAVRKLNEYGRSLVEVGVKLEEGEGDVVEHNEEEGDQVSVDG